MEKRTNKSLVLGVITLVVIIIIGVAIALIVSHKNSSNSKTLSQSQKNVAQQQIETNWKSFFASSTPLSSRVKLLQNGTNFTQSIQTEFAAFGSETSSAVISKITLNSATSATVVYTVKLAGQSVLTNQPGQAVYVDNSWEVSEATFCQLLSLAGNKPATCKNV